jgi:hypothetical protein
MLVEFKRPEFDKWYDHWWERAREFGDDTRVDANYWCEGPYGPDQKVITDGWLVTVWHPDNCMVSVSEKVTARHEARGAIVALRAEVLTMCTHPRMQRVENMGRCLNRWHCPDCDGNFDIDSSD